MKISMALAVVASIAIGTILHADTHYVSKTGSNSAPYTSWATATDSILLAVLAADSGDTIQIGAGTFTSDSISLKPGQVFRGLGSDSSHIVHNGNDTQLLIFADGCIVEGLHLSGIVDTSFGSAFYRLNTALHARGDRAGIIRNNSITDADHLIRVANTAGLDSTKRVIIEDNRFSAFFEGISVLSGHAIIRGNSFFMTNGSISGPICQLSGPVTIKNNLIVAYDNVSGGPMMDLNACSEIVIENNVCLYPTSASQPSVSINRDFPGLNTSGRIQNNLFRGSGLGVVSYGGNTAIRNNIFLDTRLIALLYDSSMTTPGFVGYNLYWNNGHEDTANDMAFLPDPGNLFADPMFADTIEYLLQAFSPAIDEGDPSILDADGSRSDIGPNGGTGGFSYVYQDLAPEVPTRFVGPLTWGDTTIEFSWQPNYEADLDHYELNADIDPCLDSSVCGSIIIPGTDTSFLYTNFILSGEFGAYFSLSAVDNQGNRSAFSDSIHYANAGIGDEIVPEGFSLRQNYPNPFNASTQITYTLSDPASVTLTVYDVMGRHVNTVVSATQSAGEYSVTWDGTDGKGNAIGSGVYFYRLTVGDEVTARKMLLLK